MMQLTGELERKQGHEADRIAPARRFGLVRHFAALWLVLLVAYFGTRLVTRYSIAGYTGLGRQAWAEILIIPLFQAGILLALRELLAQRGFFSQSVRAIRRYPILGVVLGLDLILVPALWWKTTGFLYIYAGLRCLFLAAFVFFAGRTALGLRRAASTGTPFPLLVILLLLPLVLVQAMVLPGFAPNHYAWLWSAISIILGVLLLNLAGFWVSALKEPTDSARPVRQLRILFSTGEVSGDTAAGWLARALLERCPEAQLFGVGGRRMAQAGVEILQHTSHLGSVGLVEPITTFPGLIKSFFTLRKAVNERRPDAAVLVGHEIFNWLLAWYLAWRRVPRLCLFPPQIWLWGSVLRIIGPAYTAVLSSFPEEHELYTEAGVPSYFVGHYLCDLIPQRRAFDQTRARRDLGQKDEVPLVALLPGSRSSEIRQLAPLLLDVAGQLHQVDPRIRFLLPVADPAYDRVLKEMVIKAGLQPLVRLTDDGVKAMQAADLAVMASGTASLEAALIGLPTVVVYRIARISLLGVKLARFSRLLSTRYVGLPNLLRGFEVIPEFCQGEATVAEVAGKAAQLLSDAAARDEMLLQLSQIRSALAGRHPRQDPSELVLRLLEIPQPQFREVGL